MPHDRQSKSTSQLAASDASIEALARQAYDACHPRDSFDDLKRRADFAQQDAGLLRAWIGVAQSGRLGPPDKASATRVPDGPDALAA